MFIIAELVITRINIDGLGAYLFYLKCNGSGAQQIFSMQRPNCSLTSYLIS